MEKEIAEIKTKYQILRDKAQLCRNNARKACSIWALDFWNQKAAELEEAAGNLPVLYCQAEQLNAIEMWR